MSIVLLYMKNCSAEFTLNNDYPCYVSIGYFFFFSFFFYSDRAIVRKLEWEIIQVW